jgi:hypothetical protein
MSARDAKTSGRDRFRKSAGDAIHRRRDLRAASFSFSQLISRTKIIQAYEDLRVDMMKSKPFDFDELQQAMTVLDKKASVLAEA